MTVIDAGPQAPAELIHGIFKRGGEHICIAIIHIAFGSVIRPKSHGIPVEKHLHSGSVSTGCLCGALRNLMAIAHHLRNSPCGA